MLKGYYTTIILLLILIVGISVIFELIRKGKITNPYQKKKETSNEESGYLFLNGSYFIEPPYVDSYPQY